MRKRERAERRLRAKDLDSLPPGWHEDGGGLRFLVETTGARRWVQRLTINGQRVNRGLGPYPLVTIDKARDSSTDMRRAAREGRDLAQLRREHAAKATTFRKAFDTYFENKCKELQGSRHLMQWTSQMRDYVFPKIGSKPVGEVTHADVIKVLEPIWYEKPETAKRVLQRMTSVFKSAILRGQRNKANPCDGVAVELGPRHQSVEHHRGLPHAEVPPFITLLRACSSSLTVRLAFEWLILTATRSGETRLARWSEINEEAALWTIPVDRMKAKRPHVVPLAPRCLDILQTLRTTHLSTPNTLLFPGTKRGRPLSDMTLTKVLRDTDLANRATVHGFRSSFKVWCAEVVKVRDEVSEAALAHAIKERVRAAYLRTDFLDERVGLMQHWAAYCCQ